MACGAWACRGDGDDHNSNDHACGTKQRSVRNAFLPSDAAAEVEEEAAQLPRADELLQPVPRRATDS